MMTQKVINVLGQERRRRPLIFRLWRQHAGKRCPISLAWAVRLPRNRLSEEMQQATGKLPVQQPRVLEHNTQTPAAITNFDRKPPKNRLDKLSGRLKLRGL